MNLREWYGDRNREDGTTVRERYGDIIFLLVFGVSIAAGLAVILIILSMVGGMER